jgi:hypothetical protein
MLRLEDAAEVARARKLALVGHRIEFLAGTNPLDDNSAFRITAVATEGNNLRVTWMMGPGKTNALERTAGAAGSYTNDLTGIFTVTNTFGSTTNFLDVGAATNVPSFYYRVRLVP